MYVRRMYVQAGLCMHCVHMYRMYIHILQARLSLCLYISMNVPVMFCLYLCMCFSIYIIHICVYVQVYMYVRSPKCMSTCMNTYMCTYAERLGHIEKINMAVC